MKIQTSTATAMDRRHLNAKEKGISLTTNSCVTISIKKISSIHEFILKIQQILGAHKVKGQGCF